MTCFGPLFIEDSEAEEVSRCQLLNHRPNFTPNDSHPLWCRAQWKSVDKERIKSISAVEEREIYFGGSMVGAMSQLQDLRNSREKFVQLRFADVRTHHRDGEQLLSKNRCKQ